jgi:ankyrin repeat protein
MKSTPLFEAVQRGDWEGVDFFLETGTFSFSPFQSYKDLAAPEDQAETWVVCNDENGDLLWRQLPIHAAICYGAPYKTIQELLKIYPASLSCADSEGNLPLHLAIKFNKPNDILLLIFRSFPDAMHARNGNDDCPLECTKHLQDKKAIDRYAVFQTVVGNEQKAAAEKYGRKQQELKATMKSIRKAMEMKKAEEEVKLAQRKSLPLRRLAKRVNPQKMVSSE